MLTIILDNIRSKHNVGAIFRTADAVGVLEVVLCGTTPQPRDRFGRPVGEIHKTALGAELTVPYSYHTSTISVVRDLQQAGVSVVAVEQTATARDLLTISSDNLPNPIALVFGHEVDGVSAEVLAVVDDIFALPMYGAKESLNVSVAVGVVLYLYRSKVLAPPE